MLQIYDLATYSTFVSRDMLFYEKEFPSLNMSNFLFDPSIPPSSISGPFTNIDTYL